MKKTLLLALLSAIMLVFSNVAFADDAIEDGSMSLEFRNFNPSLTFKAQVSGDASATDFKNDLGLADKKSNEFRLNLGRTLRLAYTKFSYGGFGTPTVGNVTYDGQDFDVTADVTTNIDINYYRLSWLIPVTTSDEMTTKWIIDLKAFKFNTKLVGEDPTTHNPVTVQKSFQGAIPTIGFAASFRLASNLTAYGEITGLPLGKYGHFYDMEGGVKYEIGELAIGAGYRNFDFNVKDGSTNGNNVQLKLAGPYYNVSYKF